MPNTLIELSENWPNEKKQRLVEFVHQSMIEILQIPQHDRLIRIIEHGTDNFFSPTNGSGKFVLFQIQMFPGRSIDAKRKLYQKLCLGMEEFGIAASDTRVVIQEIPMENWGIRGGQAGSDVVLGFKTSV